MKTRISKIHDELVVAKSAKDSFLRKCLEALRESGGGVIMLDYFEKHHLLRLKGKPMDAHILCTTRQAKRLIPFADESELIPSQGTKYHFLNYK